MSLESKIEALTAAVIALTERMQAQPKMQTLPVVETIVPEEVIEVAVAEEFDDAPFSDQKGLIDYMMESYKKLGPIKGTQIQESLVSLGYGNINDVKPKHYAALFAAVEKLK